MILIFKLLLAHLLGDFLFQPNSWVQAKKEKKLRAWQLYTHALLHGILILIFVWDWYQWKLALLISAVHLLIDAAKILLQKEGRERKLFFLDQAAHFASIYVIWLRNQNLDFPITLLTNENALLLLTSIFFLTQPTSVTIKLFISRWTPHQENKDTESLENAGKYIGVMERLFVFMFIATNHWEAIGFLLAAKSVFRLGDLKESRELKLTEYILIGTLISFGVAILTGFIYQNLKTS